jgi:hypothetical protein
MRISRKRLTNLPSPIAGPCRLNIMRAGPAWPVCCLPVRPFPAQPLGLRGRRGRGAGFLTGASSAESPLAVAAAVSTTTTLDSAPAGSAAVEHLVQPQAKGNRWQRSLRRSGGARSTGFCGGLLLILWLPDRRTLGLRLPWRPRVAAPRRLAIGECRAMATLKTTAAGPQISQMPRIFDDSEDADAGLALRVAPAASTGSLPTAASWP